MEKISILPRTLMQFSMDSELLKDLQEVISQENFILNRGNERSENVYLLREERYKKLNDWINSCLEEIRLDLNFCCDSLKITQSWVNKTSCGRFHHAHIHPNSLLSGIIYLTESDGSTLFGFPNDWYFTSDNDSNHSIKVSFNSGKSVEFYSHKVVPGDMIVFPSNYRHSTEPHSLDTHDRISISFTVFPNGKIGIFENLAGLEIEVK